MASATGVVALAGLGIALAVAPEGASGTLFPRSATPEGASRPFLPQAAEPERASQPTGGPGLPAADHLLTMPGAAAAAPQAAGAMGGGAL